MNHSHVNIVKKKYHFIRQEAHAIIVHIVSIRSMSMRKNQEIDFRYVMDSWSLLV